MGIGAACPSQCAGARLVLPCPGTTLPVTGLRRQPVQKLVQVFRCFLPRIRAARTAEGGPPKLRALHAAQRAKSLAPNPRIILLPMLVVSDGRYGRSWPAPRRLCPSNSPCRAVHCSEV